MGIFKRFRRTDGGSPLLIPVFSPVPVQVPAPLPAIYLGAEKIEGCTRPPPVCTRPPPGAPIAAVVIYHTLMRK